MSTLALALPAGICLGLVLGLLGGGGGLIAVPLFGALFGWSIDNSGTASMACVLTGSAVALAAHRGADRLRVRTGMTYAVPGTIGAVIGSRAAFAVADSAQHLGLASLLVVSGTLMLRKAARLRRGSTGTAGGARSANTSGLKVVVVAVLIGGVVGMFGISGGFLTVPALVTLAALTVPEATATALLVVMVNSVAALAARATHIEHPSTVALLAVATGLGAGVGARLSRRVSGYALAVGFGCLMLVIALWESHMAARTW